MSDLELVHYVDDERVLQALDGWRWLAGLEGLTPWFTSAFGDLFLVDPDGAVHYLDLIEGSVAPVWATRRACREALATTEGLDTYLLAGLAEAAFARGVVAGPGEVLAFTLPPVVGGAVSVDNLTTIDFVVGVDLAGQLHEQVRDLPPGTPISGFELR